MAFIAKCPKCMREASVAFLWDTGQKVTMCSCGHSVPADNLNFNSKPEFLYKYRPHDCYTESWILNEELFFASPAMFNDPFDSKVMYNAEGTIDQKKKYWSYLIEKKSPGTRKKKKWQMIHKALRNQTLENNFDSHIARMQQHIDKYGIVSFSRKPDDLLMFSYYAKDHSGYCLKYRRLPENILSMAQEVNYEDSYPKFSLYDLTLKEGVLGDKVLFTKASCWKHEDEWRVGFANLPKRVMKPSHPILAGIIFGCNMKPEHRKEIINLNNSRSNPTAIFEARKMKSEFALEIVPLMS